MADLSYFFYDLETTGLSASNDRLLEFAGCRLDSNLEPVAEPIDYLVKISPDVIPRPGAIVTNKISLVEANSNGLTESELVTELERSVWQPNTVFSGYNSVDFDDNFIRNLCYRNFVDPYDWQRADGCASWDLLPVMAFCRDLRPAGINWPTKKSGAPSLTLAALAGANNIKPPRHRAVDDVQATISLARLLKNRQPRLFDYLGQHRQADQISQLIRSSQPVVYSGLRYPTSLGLKTTIVVYLTDDPVYEGNLIVYDLRINPDQFADLSSTQIAERWTSWRSQPGSCPLVSISPGQARPCAGLSVVNQAEHWRSLALTQATIDHHRSRLDDSQLINKIETLINWSADQGQPDIKTVDRHLYWGGRIPEADQKLMAAVRAAKPDQLSEFSLKFNDQRLNLLLLLYKARNWPRQLDASEAAAFNDYQNWRWYSPESPYSLTDFRREIESLGRQRRDPADQELLRDLYDYVEAIAPSQASD